MGKAPLDADLRTLCQCSAGCAKPWQSPQLRYWATWGATTSPQLGAGIFIESSGVAAPEQCDYAGVVDVPGFFTNATMTRVATPAVSSASGNWLVQVFRGLSLETVNLFVAAPSEDCQAVKTCVLITNNTPMTIGPCTLTPIRWFEDADDVPH